MRLKVAREDTYEPTWLDNRKSPEKDRIKITFRFMTAEQEEKYTKMRPRYRGNMAAEEINEVEMDVESHNIEIWDDCVIKVEGIVNDATDEPITNPKAIREIPGVYGLVTEVVAHIKSGLEGLAEKN